MFWLKISSPGQEQEEYSGHLGMREVTADVGQQLLGGSACTWRLFLRNKSEKGFHFLKDQDI